MSICSAMAFKCLTKKIKLSSNSIGIVSKNDQQMCHSVLITKYMDFFGGAKNTPIFYLCKVNRGVKRDNIAELNQLNDYVDSSSNLFFSYYLAIKLDEMIRRLHYDNDCVSESRYRDVISIRTL